MADFLTLLGGVVGAVSKITAIRPQGSRFVPGSFPALPRFEYLCKLFFPPELTQVSILPG